VGLKGNAAVRAVLILVGLSGVLGFLSNYSLSCSAFRGGRSAANGNGELVPQAWLPIVLRQEVPAEPELAIYDKYGTEQDWDWLVANFGAVTLERGCGEASVQVLRETEGPTALVVRVENADGDPVENVPVVFYWPAAPLLLPEQQACGLTRGEVILTKSNGNAEFSMGPGVYYFPPDGGPHVAWVAVEGSDCLSGLGMLGGTNHIHLDSVWRMP
jgi:hypothetical protein